MPGHAATAQVMAEQSVAAEALRHREAAAVRGYATRVTRAAATKSAAAAAEAELKAATIKCGMSNLACQELQEAHHACLRQLMRDRCRLSALHTTDQFAC